jgi:radical SAM protein with 4Fe4S-binding SPASM domain
MLSSILDIEFNSNKYLVHFNRISDIASGKNVSPVVMELDISSYCDHNCVWCVDPPGTHSNSFMPVQTVGKILQEAKSMGVKGVVFKGGGESTLHPQFNEIIKIAHAYGFEIGLVTNGNHLHRDFITDSVIKYCAYIRVSIDGPTRESRKEIHGIDDFDRVIENTHQLTKERGNKRHPVIGATFCLDYSRRGLVEKCIPLGEKLKLDYILIRPPFCEEVGFTSPHNTIEAKELREKIHEVANNYNGNMCVMAGNWVGDKEYEEDSSSERRQNNMARRDLGFQKRGYNGIEHITKRCLASELYLVVTADGDVYGCCCLRGIKSYSFGKIDYSKGHNLASVLDSTQRNKSLKQMQCASCLKHCTHPMSKINEIIEYLKVPEKFHSSFI